MTTYYIIKFEEKCRFKGYGLIEDGSYNLIDGVLSWCLGLSFDCWCLELLFRWICVLSDRAQSCASELSSFKKFIILDFDVQNYELIAGVQSHEWTQVFNWHLV